MQQKSPTIIVAPQKKLIKSFKKWYSMDNSEASDSWTKLERAFDEVYKKNYSKLSFEELHRAATKMVLSKHGEFLYNGVGESITRNLLIVVDTVSMEPNERLLESVSTAWNDHKISVIKIKDVLMFVEKNYITPNRKQPVYQMAIQIFRSNLVYHPNIRPRLRTILLENVELERNGMLIDRSTMKVILMMLEELSIDGINVYEAEFEKHFIEASKEYYHQESQEFLSQNSCPSYLLKAESRISEEFLRSRNYLCQSTSPRLKAVMDNEYIEQHAKTLVDMEGSGLYNLFHDDKHEDIKRMYNLFLRVPLTLDLLRECLGKYIKDIGLAIVADNDNIKDPLQFVEKMLLLRAKFEVIIDKCCQGDKKCHKKMKDSFEEVLNIDIRGSSHLASYIDELLKGGMKALSDVELESQLDKTILLFRYIRDKDVFEDYQRGLLAKRLLNSKSVSEEAEKLMISKLKGECGQQFTSKMEGMFLDINISKEIMDGFKSSSQYRNAPIDLDVQTLTASHWALKTTPLCQFPAQILDCCNRFQGFYTEKFKTGRRLSWLAHVGNADIKANFPLGRKDLNVSTYQMCILMLFNHRATLSFNEIKAASQIPEPEIRRHLLSLCTHKIRILKKSSKGKTIEDDDVITFNTEFDSKFKRIRIPLIAAKDLTCGGAGEGDISSTMVPAAVDEDRRHMAEATVVRILKARRRIAHHDLVSEATRQLAQRFAATPPFIKQRIESLIEREYLGRDKDDLKFYVYIA